MRSATVERLAFPEQFRPVLTYLMKEGKPEQTTVLDEEIWNCSGVVYARTHEAKIVYIGFDRWSSLRTASQPSPPHPRV